MLFRDIAANQDGTGEGPKGDLRVTQGLAFQYQFPLESFADGHSMDICGERVLISLADSQLPWHRLLGGEYFFSKIERPEHRKLVRRSGEAIKLAVV